MPFAFGDFAPMECARAVAPFDDARYRFEAKLDGIRVLAYADERGRVRLQSRRGRDVSSRYPTLARAIGASLDGVAAVLDGEACAGDESGRPSLAEVLRREREADVSLHVFDVLAVGDTPVVADTLEARRERLRELLAPPDDSGVEVVGFLPASGRDAFGAAIRAGLEGVVAKRVGSSYRPGERSQEWLKVKRSDHADLVVGAWLPGKGGLASTVGALALGAYDDAGRLRFVGSVGSGLTHEEREAFRHALVDLAAEATPFADPLPREARFVRPALVVEVAFMEVTVDGRLRAPTFKGVRTDKPPRECRLATELPGWAAQTG